MSNVWSNSLPKLNEEQLIFDSLVVWSLAINGHFHCFVIEIITKAIRMDMKVMKSRFSISLFILRKIHVI